MNFDRNAFMVTWGTFSALLYAFRSTERLAIDDIKILRILRIADAKQHFLTEQEIDAFASPTVSALTRAAQDEILKVSVTIRDKIEQLESIGMIKKTEDGEKKNTKRVQLTGRARAVLLEIEGHFRHLFDAVTELQSASKKELTMQDRDAIICDPTHPQHLVTLKEVYKERSQNACKRLPDDQRDVPTKNAIEAFRVTWGALAALMAAFRNKIDMFDFEHIKILRIVRLSNYQNQCVSELDIAQSENIAIEKGKRPLTSGLLDKIARDELIKCQRVIKKRVSCLVEEGLIEKIVDPNRQNQKLVRLTQKGEELMFAIESDFCRFFDAIAMLRSEWNGGPECSLDIPERVRILCDPMHPFHDQFLPRPEYKDRPDS